jgi:hypothetical protein
VSATFFDARDDPEAISKARNFYRTQDSRKGFKLWQGHRLVYIEAALADNP